MVFQAIRNLYNVPLDKEGREQETRKLWEFAGKQGFPLRIRTTNDTLMHVFNTPEEVEQYERDTITSGLTPKESKAVGEAFMDDLFGGYNLPYNDTAYIYFLFITIPKVLGIDYVEAKYREACDKNFNNSPEVIQLVSWAIHKSNLLINAGVELEGLHSILKRRDTDKEFAFLYSSVLEILTANRALPETDMAEVGTINLMPIFLNEAIKLRDIKTVGNASYFARWAQLIGIFSMLYHKREVAYSILIQDYCDILLNEIYPAFKEDMLRLKANNELLTSEEEQVFAEAFKTNIKKTFLGNESELLVNDKLFNEYLEFNLLCKEKEENGNLNT